MQLGRVPCRFAAAKSQTVLFQQVELFKWPSIFVLKLFIYRQDMINKGVATHWQVLMRFKLFAAMDVLYTIF